MTERIPEIIPNRCGDCVYFKRGGKSLLRFFWGKCEFYKEETHANYECIAVKKYGKTPNVVPYDINKITAILCPSCDKENNPRAKFCKICGIEISPKPMVTIAFCEKCKSVYDASAKFCDEDGSKLIQKELDQEDVENPDPGELSFGWGNVYITFGFIQGSITLLFFVFWGVRTELLPNIGVALLFSFLGFGMAIGLLNRKLYGLYIVYVNLMMSSIEVLYLLIICKEPIIFFLGIIVIIIKGLFFAYFFKRKEMFN